MDIIISCRSRYSIDPVFQKLFEKFVYLSSDGNDGLVDGFCLFLKGIDHKVKQAMIEHFLESVDAHITHMMDYYHKHAYVTRIPSNGCDVKKKCYKMLDENYGRIMLFLHILFSQLTHDQVNDHCRKTLTWALDACVYISITKIVHTRQLACSSYLSNERNIFLLAIHLVCSMFNYEEVEFNAISAGCLCLYEYIKHTKDVGHISWSFIWGISNFVSACMLYISRGYSEAVWLPDMVVPSLGYQYEIAVNGVDHARWEMHDIWFMWSSKCSLACYMLCNMDIIYELKEGDKHPLQEALILSGYSIVDSFWGDSLIPYFIKNNLYHVMIRGHGNAVDDNLRILSINMLCNATRSPIDIIMHNLKIHMIPFGIDVIDYIVGILHGHKKGLHKMGWRFCIFVAVYMETSYVEGDVLDRLLYSTIAAAITCTYKTLHLLGDVKCMEKLLSFPIDVLIIISFNMSKVDVDIIKKILSEANHVKERLTSSEIFKYYLEYMFSGTPDVSPRTDLSIEDNFLNRWWSRGCLKGPHIHYFASEN